MFKLDQSQEKAVKNAVENKFAVITGGAGRGKTTIIKEIVKQITDKGEFVALSAPTGKASARLREATGVPTSTIHSLLKHNGIKFTAESLNHLHVIVDEASMVDSALMFEIIKREPKALTLIGDNAQLLPVGAGSPFHDIIRFKPEVVSELSTCYRSQEAVNRAGENIRKGLFPHNEKSAEEEFIFIATGDAESTQEYILNLVEQNIIDFDQDIILTPKNGTANEENAYTPASRIALNKAIVDIVNPRTNNEKFKIGDRVINTKNFPDKDVYNGTTGKISAIDHDGLIWIETDTPVVASNGELTNSVRFTKEMIKCLELAYAISVHKSQGSQYRNVYFLSLQRDSFNLLNRQLVYTAVTRTKSKCTVLGSKEAFKNAISKLALRKTIIQHLAKEQTNEIL